MVQLPEQAAGHCILIFECYERGVISSLPSTQSGFSSHAESIGHISAYCPGQAQQTWVRGSCCDRGRVKSNPGIRVWASSSMKTCSEKQNRNTLLPTWFYGCILFVPIHVGLNSISPLTHSFACLQQGSHMGSLPESALKPMMSFVIPWSEILMDT